MSSEDPNQRYPLYDTTFSLFRVSPLYTGSNLPLDNTILRQHAQRFRDILAGEVLRGVRVGLAPDESALARVGALQTVTWRLLLEEEAWSVEDPTQSVVDDATMTIAANRGTVLTVTYEKIAYRAILLKDKREIGEDMAMAAAQDGEPGCHHFPLLLSKMPSPLRDTFTHFLATNFDARVSQLQFSGKFLTDTFEHYLSDISIEGDGEPMDLIGRGRVLRSVVKDIVIIVGFNLPTVSAVLKTIDISIAREDLPRMLARGTSIERSDGEQSPFFNALVTYIQEHLALDLRHANVKILRIACGAFVLGGEGKIKISQPLSNDDDNSQGRATWRLINSLIATAKGTLLLNDSSRT
jgi:hypothetical protein